MLTLYNACGLEIMHGLARLRAVLRGVHQLYLARARNLHLDALVYVTVCVTRNGNRLDPVLDIRLDTLDEDRRTEYGAV